MSSMTACSGRYGCRGCRGLVRPCASFSNSSDRSGTARRLGNGMRPVGPRRSATPRGWCRRFRRKTIRQWRHRHRRHGADQSDTAFGRGVGGNPGSWPCSRRRGTSAPPVKLRTCRAAPSIRNGIAIRPSLRAGMMPSLLPRCPYCRRNREQRRACIARCSTSPTRVARPAERWLRRRRRVPPVHFSAHAARSTRTPTSSRSAAGTRSQTDRAASF